MILLSDPRMAAHDPGPLHPERPGRLHAIEEELARQPIPGVTRQLPREVTPDELAAVHTPTYLAEIAAIEGHFAQLDADTVVSPPSILATRLAAGAAAQAVELAHTGPDRRIFALSRPPGHHALAHTSMGFCVYANAAIAAAKARALGFERIAVLDWDVHHGNGTQALFEDRDDVLFCSTHQAPPFWPGSGASTEVGTGAGAGFTVNLPLPPGATDADHTAALDRVFLPIARQFRPDLVIVSAGFDAHRDDPLGGQAVTEEGFAALCARAVALADEYAGGRLILLLEGGYDLGGLARSVAACAQVLTGATAPEPHRPRPAAEAAIRRTLDAHASFWEIG